MEDKMKTYFTTPSQSSTKATFKIVTIYFIISILWIFFSDTLVSSLELSLSTQTTVSIIKGWGFVIVTSMLLYYLIRKSTGHIIDEHNMFTKIVETVPVGITFVSKEGRITFANKNAEKILGLKKEQITSRTYNATEWKITSLDGSPFPDEQLPFSIVQRTGNAVNNIEHALEYVSGRRTLLSINAAPIKDRNNNFDGMISVIDDITDRKQAEDEILKLNRVYAVISQINQAIVHIRERDKLLSEACRVAIEFGKFQLAWIGLVDEETQLVNPVIFAGIEDGYLSKIKKISISEVAEGRGPTGTAIREGRHFVCDDIENDPRMVPWKDEALKRGYRSSIALPIKLFGKVTGAFSFYSSAPHFFDQKEIVLLDEVASDISFALEAIEVGEKRKETEQTLLDSEKRYRELFMNHPHPMWIYEVDSLKIIEVNESAIKNYGYTKDEFTSLTLKDIRPEEDVPLLLNNVKTHNESIQRDRTFRHKKKDGTITRVEISSHNLPSIKDTNYRIVMAIDITEQYKAEEALHESEERFRTAFQHSASGMCLTAMQGNFLQVNKALCQMLGYSSEELLNTTFAQITHPDDLSLSYNFVDSAIGEKGKTLHFEKRYLKKNGDVIWTEVSSSLLSDAKKKPLYFITQIIDITERKRAEKERQKFVMLADSSSEFIGMCDLDFKPLYVNPAGVRMVGLTDMEAACRVKVQDYFFPEDQRFITEEFFPRVLHKGHGDVEIRLRHFQTGKAIWMFYYLFSVREADGTAIGWATVSRDITERKRAEEEIKKSHEELRALSAHLQNVREDERKNLAREMHDEVGQILTSIKMNLSLIKRQVEDNEKKLQTKELDEEIKSMSKMVDHAVVRVRKMITELRPELLDKLGLIPALEWYTEEYAKETKIKCSFKGDFEELSLDHTIELTIFRIVQEALTNVARHSTASNVIVSIKKSENEIVVEIVDNGIGISEERLLGDKSFGLLGMRERANLVGGKIEISGIAGKGTTVKLVISV